MKILYKDERGIASIFVTVTFSIIISIVVLSFALISRREQRQALDRQLSSQAYYAAESAINGAVAALKANPSYTKDTCEVIPLSSEKFVFQTCALVSSPKELIYDVNTTNSKFFLVRSQTNFNQLTFKWSPINSTDIVIPGVSSCINGSSCFKPDSSSGWGSQMGVLRLQVIAVPKSVSVTRNQILYNTYDLIGIPESSTGNTFNTPSYVLSPNPGTSPPSKSNSLMLSGKCSTSKECSLIMNGLSGGAYDYYVRAFSYYKDIRLNVSGAIQNDATVVRFIGSQATIDSTGRSGDVLRRVKVNKTINFSDSLSSSTSFMPPFVVSVSDGLCKKLETNTTSTKIANTAPICNF